MKLDESHLAGIARLRRATIGSSQRGFCKGGFSNLCLIIVLLSLNPPLLNPLCELPKRLSQGRVIPAPSFRQAASGR